MIAAASCAGVGAPADAELELLVLKDVVGDEELVVAGELDVVLVVASVDEVAGAVEAAVVGPVLDPIVTGGATADLVEGAGTVVVPDPFVVVVRDAGLAAADFFRAEALEPDAAGAGAFVDDLVPAPDGSEDDDPGGAASAPFPALCLITRKPTSAAAATTSAMTIPSSAPTGRRRPAGSASFRGSRGLAPSDSGLTASPAGFPANCPVHSRVGGLPGKSRALVGAREVGVERVATGVRTGSC